MRLPFLQNLPLKLISVTLATLLWFIIGRGRANRVGSGRGRTLAPDDDAEFLRQLREDAAQDERIRRLEQELADLDADDAVKPPKPGRVTGEGSTDGLEASTGDALGTERKRPDAPDAPRNRAIEAKVQELGGHKSLYSEAFYDRETFDRLYDGTHLAAVKKRYDPDDRLLSLYDKAVRDR